MANGGHPKPEPKTEGTKPKGEESKKSDPAPKR